MPDVACCTAIENSDHPLNQGCGIISIYLKGISDGETKTKTFTSEFKAKIEDILGRTGVLKVTP